MPRHLPTIHFTSLQVLGRWLPVFAVSCAVVGAIVGGLYWQDRRNEHLIVGAQRQSLVQFESEMIAQEFRNVQSDLVYLAQQSSLAKFLSGDETRRRELEQEYERFCVRKAVYDQIRCLNLAGKEMIRVDYRDGFARSVSLESLQDKTGRYYVRRAMPLSVGHVFVSPFDLNVEHGQIEQPPKPVIRFLTPIFNEAGEKRGLLVLNYLGAHLLKKLSDSFHRLTDASIRDRGSVWLLNFNGEYLRGPGPDDEWGWMLGHDRSFRTQFPDAWQDIHNLESGQFLSPQGLFTFRRVSAERDASNGLAASLKTGSPVLREPRDAPTPEDGLLLMSHVPLNVLHDRSQNLLRRLLAMYAGTTVLLLAFSWYWAHASAVRRQQERQIAKSETRLRKLSSQLLAGQEDERRRISRELHDNLGQQVTAISLDLQSAARHKDPVGAKQLVDRAIGETDGLLQSLHAIASHLRPSVLDDLGLLDAVESHLTEWSQRTKVEVVTHLDLDARPCSREIGENAYRILQEALTNVARHAHASEVHVTMILDEAELRIRIEDDGRGFEPQQLDGSRLGVLGMQERVELLGGTFELSAAPGAGTRIEVVIPVEGS